MTSYSRGSTVGGLWPPTPSASAGAGDGLTGPSQQEEEGGAQQSLREGPPSPWQGLLSAQAGAGGSLVLAVTLSSLHLKACPWAMLSEYSRADFRGAGEQSAFPGLNVT